MKHICYCSIILLLASPGIRADQQTPEAAKQAITAVRTKQPIVIDGVFGAGEWKTAIPVHVDAIRPGEAPGIIPWVGLPGGLNPPDNQDDSSFTIRAMYDDNYLYVAVDVADDNIIADNPENPWLDDDVEIFIDGDNKPSAVGEGSDMDAIRDYSWVYGVVPNNEGFQVVTSAGNARRIYPVPDIQVNWDSHAALRPRGFLVETRISLDSINTIDNSWWTNPLMTPADPEDFTQSLPYGIPFEPKFRRPQPGDSIGFNAVVGDDDCGRQPGSLDPMQDSWNRTDLITNPSSQMAWDGSSANYWYAEEADWGTLYFAP